MEQFGLCLNCGNDCNMHSQLCGICMRSFNGHDSIMRTKPFVCENEDLESKNSSSSNRSVSSSSNILTLNECQLCLNCGNDCNIHSQLCGICMRACHCHDWVMQTKPFCCENENVQSNNSNLNNEQT